MANTLWMLLSQFLRLVFQGIYFLIISRALGVQGFGALAAAMAFVAILATFSSFGSGNVLVMRVSRDHALFPTYWGNALFSLAIGSSILTLAMAALHAIVLPEIALSMLVILTISECLFGGIANLAGQAFQAFERLRWTAGISTLVVASRSAAAGGFVTLSDTMTAETWVRWNAISLAAVAVIAILCTSRLLGRPRVSFHLLPRALRDGWHFSISLASFTVYSDVDKVMLARLSTLEATGTYAAAYRITNLAFVPVRSLLAATYAKFFQRGMDGISGTLALTLRLLPITVAYGISAGIAIWIAAPLVPRFLGEEYASSVSVLRWLSLLPLIQSIHYFAADTLTGAGFQQRRSRAQVATAGLNILLNFWLIPLYSWQGAVWATLVSEIVLLITLWVLVVMAPGRPHGETAL